MSEVTHHVFVESPIGLACTDSNRWALAYVEARRSHEGMAYLGASNGTIAAISQTHAPEFSTDSELIPGDLLAKAPKNPTWITKNGRWDKRERKRNGEQPILASKDVPENPGRYPNLGQAIHDHSPDARVIHLNAIELATLARSLGSETLTLLVSDNVPTIGVLARPDGHLSGNFGAIMPLTIDETGNAPTNYVETFNCALEAYRAARKE